MHASCQIAYIRAGFTFIPQCRRDEATTLGVGGATLPIRLNQPAIVALTRVCTTAILHGEHHRLDQPAILLTQPAIATRLHQPAIVLIHGMFHTALAVQRPSVKLSYCQMHGEVHSAKRGPGRGQKRLHHRLHGVHRLHRLDQPIRRCRGNGLKNPARFRSLASRSGSDTEVRGLTDCRTQRSIFRTSEMVLIMP